MLYDTPMICQFHGKRQLELLCLETDCQSGERRGCRQCFNSNPTIPGKHSNHKFAELTEIYEELQQFSLSQSMEDVKQRAKESIALVHRELDDWYMQVVCKCENLENRYEGIGNINLNGNSLYELYRLSTQPALAPITQGIIIFTQQLLAFIQTHSAYLSRYFSEEYYKKKKDAISKVEDIIKEIHRMKQQSESIRISKDSQSSHHDMNSQENNSQVQNINQQTHSSPNEQKLLDSRSSKINKPTAIPNSFIAAQPTDFSLKSIESVINSCYTSIPSSQTSSSNSSFKLDIQQLISQPFPFDLEDLENPVDSHVVEFNEKSISNGHLHLQQTMLAQLQDGVQNGRLFYFNTQGEFYEGYVKDGLKHGKGKYCNILQNQAYLGGFTANKKTGFGVLLTLNEKYEGYFFDDQYNGKGKIIYLNGDSIEGTFKKGLIHGKGRLTDAKGESVSITWSHGEIQKEEESEEQKRQFDKSEEAEENEEEEDYDNNNNDCREDNSKD